MKGNKKMWIAIAAGLVLLAVFIIFGMSSALTVIDYTINTDLVTKPVKLALISDLHSCKYGEGQLELLNAIKAQSPDAILLSGDIFDDDMPQDNARELISAIAGEYACYYVTGNHEIRTGDEYEIKQFVRDTGVTVLEDEYEILSANEQMLNIVGIDDPTASEKTLTEQLSVCETVPEANFTVLLAHRPELINEYLTFDMDLVLSGHAHGGQWRIPGLMNGLIAPNQGLFPKYAGGEYQFGDKTMIVSRGLAKESTIIPRVFNRPELVIVTIAPFSHE